MRPRTTVSPIDHVERHLDVDRGAGRPRRRRERGLQLGQAARRRRAPAGRRPRRAGRRGRTAARRRRTAAPSRETRCPATHAGPAGPAAGDATAAHRGVGVAPEVDQLLTDSCGGQRRGRAAGGHAVPLGEQRVDIGGPALGVVVRRAVGRRVIGRVRTSAAPRSTSARRAPERVGRPDGFDDLVAQRVRVSVGRASAPSARRRRIGVARRRPTASMMSLSSDEELRRAARLGLRRRPSGARTAAACPRRG